MNNYDYSLEPVRIDSEIGFPKVVKHLQNCRKVEKMYA
jgi:hypothetical protein